MKVLITGATGFIGRRLTRLLLDRGSEVVALARDPRSAAGASLRQAGATLVKGDVTDRASLSRAMVGADVVIHAAAWYEMGLWRRHHARMRAVNVQGTANTLEVAWDLGVERIFHISSIVAFGPTGTTSANETFLRRVSPVSCYEATKAEAHQVAVGLQERGAPVTILCPAVVIGPGDSSSWGRLARLYVQGWMPPIGWGRDSIFPFIHVDDAAEAIALAVERGMPGEIYLLVGTTTTLGDLAAVWRQTPGWLPSIRWWLSRPAAMVMGAAAEWVLRLFGQPAFISRETVATAFESWHFSGAKAARELGVRFRTAEQAWLDTLAAEREHCGRGR